MAIELSTAEVASLKGCSTQYIRRLAKTEELKGHKCLNADGSPGWMFLVEELPTSLQEKYYNQLRASLPEKAKPKAAKPLDTYSIDEQEEIAFWLRLVKQWQDYRNKPGANKTEVDARFVQWCKLEYPERAISVDTLYRRWNAVRANDLDGLIDKRGKWKKGRSSIPDPMWQAFLYFFLDERQHPLKKCYEYTKLEMQTSFPELVGDITKITTDDIRTYIGYLADERRLKDSSIQTHINTLRSFFSWLDMEDIIKKNPMRKIRSLKIDRMKARRPLSPEELEQLRDGCCSYKEKALVEFLVSSGCRLNEVTGIRTDQIDWQSRSVVVLGKGHKERTVYFSVRAKLMLREYLSCRKGGEALFASTRKPYAAMSPRAVEKALQRIGERAGETRRIYPHLMRHTFATNALHGGMDITTIQHLLGHSDPKTTLIYAELRPDAIRYAYEKVIA